VLHLAVFYCIKGTNVTNENNCNQFLLNAMTRRSLARSEKKERNETAF
jgi:hypothetical protein